MAIVRDSKFTITDHTPEINLIPKIWSLITGMNLFSEVHNITGTTADVEYVTEVQGDIPARLRGGERNYVGSENAKVIPLKVPFYPLDRRISPKDIQSFRQYGSGNEAKTVLTEVTRVMQRIRNDHTVLIEKAQAAAIQGIGLNGIAPNTHYNYFTEFGFTQTSVQVDFTSGSVDPATTIEKDARRTIITSAQDGTDSHASYSLVTICHPEWFDAFIAHPDVEEAYTNYASEQEPLRKRLGMNNPDDSVRVFRHKDVTYIEDLSGNFPAGEAFMMPRDFGNMFRCYYSPADDLEYANTEGQELYLWYKGNDFDRQYKVESEASFLMVNTRPDLVIRLTGLF